MQEIDLKNIVTQKINFPLLLEKNIEANVLRLDTIHPEISGNKWFKLRYHLEEASELGKKTILTFGGAWSNHLLATAAACQLNGFKPIGIVRGEKPTVLSPVLSSLVKMGMELVFTSREEYRKKQIPESVEKKDCYIIPEGGYSKKGMEGAATIAGFYKNKNYSHICLAAGTGTTAAGLLLSALPGSRVLVFSVLKNNEDLVKNISDLTGDRNLSPEIIHEYSFGGYAKYTTELTRFMNRFYEQTLIPSDFVYTGKLFFGVMDLCRKDYFPAGSNLLIIHSGGLKGNESLTKGTLIF